MRRPRQAISPARPDRSEQLAQELRALPASTTRRLTEQWRKLLGTSPPAGLSRDLLTRGIAQALQQAVLGGLPPRHHRRLAALVAGWENGGNSTEAASPTLRLKPGAKLVRVWRGHAHCVLVLRDGFEHQGTRYRSLSEIAEVITGAHWSGPRFFGLTATARVPTSDRPSTSQSDGGAR